MTIALSDSEIAILTDWSCRAPNRLSKRARIILDLATEAPTQKVANKFRVSKNRVSIIESRFLKEGVLGLLDSSRTGRPTKLFEVMKDDLFDLLQEECVDPEDVKRLASKHNVSCDAIWRTVRILDGSLSRQSARSVPVFVTSDIARRLVGLVVVQDVAISVQVIGPERYGGVKKQGHWDRPAIANTDDAGETNPNSLLNALTIASRDARLSKEGLTVGRMSNEQALRWAQKIRDILRGSDRAISISVMGNFASSAMLTYLSFLKLQFTHRSELKCRVKVNLYTALEHWIANRPGTATAEAAAAASAAHQDGGAPGAADPQ